MDADSSFSFLFSLSLFFFLFAITIIHDVCTSKKKVGHGIFFQVSTILSFTRTLRIERNTWKPCISEANWDIDAR